MIELLAVIAIVALLAALLFPLFGRMRTRANDATDMAHLRTIHSAWLLATTDNNGRVVMGHDPSAATNRSERHWPGRLAPYLGLKFPPDEFSVYLDHETLPTRNVLTQPDAPPLEAGARRQVAYGMNYLATGTFFSGGYVGALRSNGEMLENQPRIHQVSPQAIVFATGTGSWHLGSDGPKFEGKTISELGKDARVILRASEAGQATFIRMDGSAFASDVVPPAESWYISD